MSELTGAWREAHDRFMRGGADDRERLGQGIQALQENGLVIHGDVVREALECENCEQLLPELMADPVYRERLAAADSPEKVRQVVRQASSELANGGASDDNFDLKAYRATANRRQKDSLTKLQRRA